MKKLYRSRTNKMIAGVCGGLADYFNIDATIVRIGFILLCFMSGFGVLLYIVLWVIVPREGDATQTIDRGHLTSVAAEMRDKAQEVVKEVKETVEGFKKKSNGKKKSDKSVPSEDN